MSFPNGRFSLVTDAWVDLLQRSRAIRAEHLLGRNVPELSPLLQRIDIDMADLRPRGGLIERGNPGDIAIEHQHEVGFRKRGILYMLVPLLADIAGMIGWEIQVAGNGFEYPDS